MSKHLTVTQLNSRPFAVKVNQHTNVLEGDVVFLIAAAKTAPRQAYGEPAVTVVKAWTTGVVTVRFADSTELTTSGENVRHRRPDRSERAGGVRLMPGRNKHIDPDQGEQLDLLADIEESA